MGTQAAWHASCEAGGDDAGSPWHTTLRQQQLQPYMATTEARQRRTGTAAQWRSQLEGRNRRRAAGLLTGLLTGGAGSSRAAPCTLCRWCRRGRWRRLGACAAPLCSPAQCTCAPGRGKWPCWMRRAGGARPGACAACPAPRLPARCPTSVHAWLLRPSRCLCRPPLTWASPPACAPCLSGSVSRGAPSWRGRWCGPRPCWARAPPPTAP